MMMMIRFSSGSSSSRERVCVYSSSAELALSRGDQDVDDCELKNCVSLGYPIYGKYVSSLGVHT